MFCWRLPGSLPAGRKKGVFFFKLGELAGDAPASRVPAAAVLLPAWHPAARCRPCLFPSSQRCGGEQLGFVTRLRLRPAAPAASQLRVLPSAAFRAAALVSSCGSAFSMSHHCSCRGRFASFRVFLLVGALPNSLNAAGAAILHPEQGGCSSVLSKHKTPQQGKAQITEFSYWCSKVPGCV